MAAVQCIKCTAEKRGFRRELDSWRHKLIHCIGFESILEGIYGPLLGDLNLFADCEPEEVDDWAPEGSCSQCSFCKVPLDKLSDLVPAASSPLSSPSEYSPCQAAITAESQSAHRFLQAVFHKKDVPTSCDSNIPLIAQELMKNMIHRFAKEYASECLLQTRAKSVTRTSSPLAEASDAPLDLTVSRTQEEKEAEPEPDGALDLSNRNAASSTTLSSSSSSDDHQASGSPQSSLTEAPRVPAQRGTKFHCVLDAVLSPLCRAHRSLLYQILKVASQEKLLPADHKHVDQTESHCCPCAVAPQVAPPSVPSCECPDRSSSCPSADCPHQSPDSTENHREDSKCTCSSLHQVKSYKTENQQGVRCSCVQMCGVETHTIGCLKRLHCISCRSLDEGRIGNISCSFAPSPPLYESSSCSCCPPSSVCCSHHLSPFCPCHPNQVCLTQVKRTTSKEVGDGDPPCPVLKRENNCSPPPLSPIPPDINGKADEKPPSLLHHKQEEPSDVRVESSLANVSHQETVGLSTDADLQCKNQDSNQTKLNPSGTLLQDVMNRFSEKLETIRPLDKDPTLVSTAFYVSEKEQLQTPSTSQNLQFHADAHLTEIITTVLHTGSASDYNLSELFNRHDNRESKSPKTRSRRRQEVLAAIATPADDASTRRHTLQIKRELAMLDHSCNKKKVQQAKKPRWKDGNDGDTVSHPASYVNVMTDVSKTETDAAVCPPTNQKVDVCSDFFPSESHKSDVKEEIQAEVASEGVEVIKTEANDSKISCEEEKMNISDIGMQSQELHCKYDEQAGSDGVETQKILEPTTSAEQCWRLYKCDEEAGDAACEEKLENLPESQISVTENKAGEDKEDHNHVRKEQISQSNHLKGARRSGRSIVPPQRFSSYVTEPRKMFFVACFSEKIFNRDAEKETDLTPSVHASPRERDAEDTQLESTTEKDSHLPKNPSNPPFEQLHGVACTESENKTQDIPQAAKEKSPVEHSSDNTVDSSVCDAPLAKTLRSSPRRPRVPLMPHTSSQRNTSSVETQLDSHVTYTSPIKLMFVSPVKDKEGIRYSLKSAGSGSGSQAEHFDPCEESSWSGTPVKHRSPSQESAPSKAKSVSSPLRSATSRTGSAPSSPKSASSPKKSSPSPPKSASSPRKSGSSTPKSAPSSPKSASSLRKSAPSTPKSAPSSPKSASSSPKSASSPRKSASLTPKSASLPLKSSSPRSATPSPKNGSRRSVDGTPTKRVAGSESSENQGDLPNLYEATPPKRRPGRPKKLGPQLEQKAKRPIGRPRKQKPEDPVMEQNPVDGKSLVASDAEENVNKNLKITVMYGRSRRNKRLVSESFDQLQTEFSDAWQAVGLKSDFGLLLENSKTNSGSIKRTSDELNFVSPEKELVLQSSSNVKCQKQDDLMPSRKPGRPAKVKISGISVTVTTVSPRQRKIQMNKDTRQSLKTPFHKKALLPQFKSTEDSRPVSCCVPSKRCRTEEAVETDAESKEGRSVPPVAVRHSMRVRKPSIHFLRAVATSSFRSYSRSNALLRRSKQLLLSKASNERRQEEQQSCAATPRDHEQPSGQETKATSQDLTKVAGVSLGPIFSPTETLRWWAPSAEEKTLNQELARRIRVISDTWVSDSRENQDHASNPERGAKVHSSVSRKSKHSSVVRTLFDCPPNRPRSCSMQQICSWFMQTTETQSLAIVKKVSARNLYDPAQFSRSANNKVSVCNSPQAERLRKHVKKFAKAVPKSPSQHREALRQLSKKNKGIPSTRRRLFNCSLAKSKQKGGAQRSVRGWGAFQATLMRAKTRFLTRKARKGWLERQSVKKNKVSAVSSYKATTPQAECKASRRAARAQSNCVRSRLAIAPADQTQESVDECKELNLSSKAWSPETLKECRVFLRKINSPDNESAEEEWDSCTVTLDDGSTSACLFAASGGEVGGDVKAVKTERRRRQNGRRASTEPAGPASKTAPKQDESSAKTQKRKYRSPGVVSTEPPQSPPAKNLRQSRMRGLTGPKWSDFVFES